MKHVKNRILALLSLAGGARPPDALRVIERQKTRPEAAFHRYSISNFMIIHSKLFFRLLAVSLALCTVGLRASVAVDLQNKIAQSEFVFPVNDSNAPFLPISWLNASYYSDSQAHLPGRDVNFKVWTESEALMAPVWVGRKDMVIVGEYGSVQQIKIQSPNPGRINITTFVPVAAWLRQFSPKTQGGAFLAPNFVNGGEYNGYSLSKTSVYAGAFAIHWSSDHLAWVSGLVGYAESGDTLWLPYLGAIWRPTQNVSVSVVVPWPDISYAPTPHLMFQLGMSPAGTTVGASKDGQQLGVGFTSWNLLFSVHRQLTKSLWLSAGGGKSGFGSVTISSSGEPGLKHELDRGPVFFLQLSLRPPTSSVTAPPPVRR